MPEHELATIRAELEAAAADLRAATTEYDTMIAACEATGSPPNAIDVAILGAIVADAAGRGRAAEIRAAVFVARHPDVRNA